MSDFANPLFAMALMTGLLGTGHCLGMCGGLVSALSLSAEGRRAGVLFPVFYHVGRLSTYGLIGLLVGWLGSAMTWNELWRAPGMALLLASDVLVIGLGLAIVGVVPRFGLLDWESPRATRVLAGLSLRLRQLPAPLSCLCLGVLMGLLPCCFLYAMVLAAVQSGSGVNGAGVLVAFGLGTVPGLVLVGGVAQWLGKGGRLWMVRCAGAVIVVMGGYNLWRHVGML